MKVLEMPKEPKPYVFKCKGCKAKLEATYRDVKRWNKDRDGTAAVFECPVCGSANWVDGEQLPKWQKFWSRFNKKNW